MTERTSSLRESFDARYTARDGPWELVGPAAVVVRLEEAGRIVGEVLDAGCGIGKDALFLAARGHPVLGIDFSAVAIRRAGDLAAGLGLPVTFRVHDALALGDLGRRFDTVLDVGCFDCFTPAERSRYTAGLAGVLRPGGRAVIVTFAVKSFRSTRLLVRPRDVRRAFSHGGWEVEAITSEWMTGPLGPVPAWLTQVRRDEGEQE